MEVKRHPHCNASYQTCTNCRLMIRTPTDGMTVSYKFEICPLHHLDLDEWAFKVKDNFPQQNDADSCGVATVMAAFHQACVSVDVYS
jgi:hypothetical protein